MGALIIVAITYIMGYLTSQLLTWLVGSIDGMYYLSMCIERAFPNSINVSGLYQLVYSFAIGVLCLCFVKKLIETYMAWSNGDPDSSPISVLIGFIKALIIMISFGYLYTLFVQVFKDLYDQIVSSMGVFSSFKTTLNGFSFIGSFIYLLIAIKLFIIYFQMISRGMEMLILRIGIPFACVGLLNADGGAFKGYIQKFLKTTFTVILQLSLVHCTLLLIQNAHYIIGYATLQLAEKTPSLMQEFLATSNVGSGVSRGFSSAVSTVSHLTGILKSGK